MKLLFSAVLSLVSFLTTAQLQQQIDKIKTNIDLSKTRYIDSLVKLIGDKRIVALGEDTHGTAQYYELRSAITQRLIKEKGFNVVILENPHEDMTALQNGLRNEKLDSLMRKHLFSIYQSRQMKSFLEWFKKYSKKHKNLKLAGCDDSYRELLPIAMQQEVAKYGNSNLDKWTNEFFLRQTLSLEEFYQHPSVQKRDSLPDEMEYGLDTYRLLNSIDSLCKEQDIKNSKLEELIFHAKTAYVFYDRYARKISVSRDEIMGERINYYAKDPTAKIIVWAHNGHIARYAWLGNELGMMGATVAKHFPNDYFAIGMSTGQGSYSYISNRFINDDHEFTDSLLSESMLPTKIGSWNEAFQSNSSANYFIDFSKLNEAETKEWEVKKTLRVLGYNKESTTAKEYYPVSVNRLFNVLIFIRSTDHTTALFN